MKNEIHPIMIEAWAQLWEFADAAESDRLEPTLLILRASGGKLGE